MSREYICPHGHKHRTETGLRYCLTKEEFLKKSDAYCTTKWTEEGTTEDLMDFDEFRDLFWPHITIRIKQRDGERCVDCGKKEEMTSFLEPKLSTRLEVHHIIPRSQGGSDHPANLKTLCHECHWKYHRHREKEIILPTGQQTLNMLGGMEYAP